MKKTKTFLITLFISIAPVLAESELISNNDEIKEVLNKGAYEPSYIMLFAGLFLVLTLVYFTGIIYQKLIKVKLNNEENNEINKIEIVSTTPLGQNKNLHVIKLNGEYSLISSTQNNISLLKELGKEEEIYEKNSQNKE